MKLCTLYACTHIHSRWDLLFQQHINHLSKKPYIHAKEPWIPAPEPYISANETCSCNNMSTTYHKSPLCLPKEPYISANQICSYANWSTFFISPSFSTISITYQKSPIFLPKEPYISTNETCSCANLSTFFISPSLSAMAYTGFPSTWHDWVRCDMTYIYMGDMTHSYNCNALQHTATHRIFLCVIQLGHMWHDLFIYRTWLIHINYNALQHTATHRIPLCVTQLGHMAKTYLYMGHDSFM